jgi:hypothetical protein
MIEIKRARLDQTVRSKVHSRSKIFCSLAMLLCFVCVVTFISSLFEGNLRVRAAAPQGKNEVEKLRPPVMNLPRLASYSPVFSNSGPPAENLWRENPGIGMGESVAEIGAPPKLYRALSLNEMAQREVLRHAPMEFSKAARQTQVVITLPMPDGTFARFRVEESPVLAPQLAARFPAIRTYRGRGLDDETAITRFDMTPAGFHAIVLSARGTVIIEPEAHGPAGKYVSYDQRNEPQDAGSSNCLLFGAEQSLAQSQSRQFSDRVDESPSVTTGATLRTYRLALAATAEYTQIYGGGTVSGSLSAMTTTINAVNAIYERDLSIRLVLVNNETSIIFTNSATDGYTSDNATLLLTQNQAVLDQRIGPSNYDLGMVLDGHVFAFQPGRFIFQGAAQYQSACGNAQKGKGVSIFRSTEPSSTNAIYVLAHELGHMLGALHTFNGTTSDCGPSRFAQVAFEPGSGSTIMGYRGGLLPDGTYWPLCGTEELFSNDTYFHAASIEQIVNYTTFGQGSICPVRTDTGNNPPAVDAGPDYTIPAGTPFTLTATASDPDGDALTYCWEEYDLGDPGPPHTDNGNRPIFRSFAPTPNPARTFPQPSDILSGTSTFGESLPVTTRTMNFRVTVRDNRSGGGGVNSGAMRISVESRSGPFAVTQPSSLTTTTAGSTQTVTWDVAHTSSAPVSCANVRILLSVDGGVSFQTILAQNVPNNGAATITVPHAPTSTARVKVEAVGNIFFAISDTNFSITAAPSPTSTPTPPAGSATIQLSAADFSVNENDPTGAVSIVVTRNGDASSAAVIDYATSDTSGLVSCQTNGNGIASERCDYATAAGTLRFAANEQSKSIQIPIINDAYVEPLETFNISLRNPQGAVSGTVTNATITIQSDDTQGGTQNPIDHQSFFIREQYIDFLGRLSEEAGFNFWNDRMNNCLAGQVCDRTDTSQRFFQSDEFQERGFYVYRLYDALLGRLPKYVEFVPEVARLNGPQTVQEQRLGKDAYLLDFMNKNEFTARYGQHLSANHLTATDAAGFVNALCARSGITPAIKQNLISNLQGGFKDPARTLEDFILTAEMSSIGTLYYDRGFITMQYFGYLRRDPEAAGFDFWQNQLMGQNAPHRQDYRFMVGGFLQSDEYRFRFALIPSAP